MEMLNPMMEMEACICSSASLHSKAVNSLIMTTTMYNCGTYWYFTCVLETEDKAKKQLSE